MRLVVTTFLPAADRYEAMQYRRTGRSGLLPVVSFSLWHNFGDDRSLETQREIIRRAFDLGITHLDLATTTGRRMGPPRRTWAASSTATCVRTETS
jgi:L-glyceraldehyde 3-phosphate reductase